MCVGETQVVRGGLGSGVLDSPVRWDKVDQYSTTLTCVVNSVLTSCAGDAMSVMAAHPISLRQSGVTPLHGTIGLP